MKGFATERWSLEKMATARNWLTENFGKPSPETWYEDQDYDLFALMMNEEIFSWYKLRWA